MEHWIRMLCGDLRNYGKPNEALQNDAGRQPRGKGPRLRSRELLPMRKGYGTCRVPRVSSGENHAMAAEGPEVMERSLLRSGRKCRHLSEASRD